MPAATFDFDVITGPSTPRDDRDESSPRPKPQVQPVETGSQPPRTR